MHQFQYNDYAAAFRCKPKQMGTVFSKTYSTPKVKVVVRTPGRKAAAPALTRKTKAQPQKREKVGIIKRTRTKGKKKKVTFAKKRRTYAKRIAQAGDPVERKFVEADDGTVIAVPRKKGKVRIV